MSNAEQQARELAERCALGCYGNTAEDTETILERLNLVALLEDKAMLNELRVLMGYTSQASDCEIRISEDDATHSICLQVGKQTYYGDTLRTAITNAMREQEEAK